MYIYICVCLCKLKLGKMTGFGLVEGCIILKKTQCFINYHVTLGELEK